MGPLCRPEVNPTFLHLTTIRGRGGSGTPQPCWTGTSCCWAGTAATARSLGSLCPPSTAATMSLPSVAAFAPGTWWNREYPHPPMWVGPTEEGCRVILHLQQCVLPPRAVATSGVTVRRSSVLAVETVSLLTVEAAIPRKEQVTYYHSKATPLFAFSEGFLFDLVHDATGGCAIAGDGEVEIGQVPG